MQGNCPRCQTRLELPASGAYQCERCKARFEVALGAPTAPAAPPPTIVPGPYPSSPGPGQAGVPPYPVGAVPYPGAQGWAQPEPVLDVDAPCAGHPSNPASRVCERCGDFMCRLCTTHVEGRAYCPKCFDLLYNRGALSFTQRQFALPGITLALGITSLVAFLVCLLFFGFILAVPAGIGGLITGARALRSYQERPELTGRQMNAVGMWLSGVGLFLGLVNFGFWVYVWVSRS